MQPGTSSDKQRKIHSPSQPQICSQKNHRKTEAKQIILAPQQLASNNNNFNFKNNINRESKPPKSLGTTMPTFDGKSEMFELFENLFLTRFKTHNRRTNDEKMKTFTLPRRNALQKFKHISSLT